MNINDCFPSTYLKASDIGNVGAIRPITIDRVEVQDVNGNGEMKPILFVQGEERGIVLNKTNSETLSLMFGPETTAWHSQLCTLAVRTTTFNGKTVPCIRVEGAQAPPQAQMQPQTRCRFGAKHQR